MRRKLTALTGLFAVLALIVLQVPGASAQTGYPPGGCTATVGSQNAGNASVGQTLTITVTPTCAFGPSNVVNVVVNGVSVGTKAANANGTVTVTVRVVSQTQLEIDDPVTVTGHCGVNTTTVTGFSPAANANVTQTANFNVLCPAATATPTPARVAFTGADILRWSAVALALLVAGSLLVLGARRRSRANA